MLVLQSSIISPLQLMAEGYFQVALLECLLKRNKWITKTRLQKKEHSKFLIKLYFANHSREQAGQQHDDPCRRTNSTHTCISVICHHTFALGLNMSLLSITTFMAFAFFLVLKKQCTLLCCVVQWLETTLVRILRNWTQSQSLFSLLHGELWIVQSTFNYFG